MGTVARGIVTSPVWGLEKVLTRFAVPMAGLSTLGSQGVPSKVATGLSAPFLLLYNTGHALYNDTGARTIAKEAIKWTAQSGYNLADNIANRPGETIAAAIATYLLAEAAAFGIGTFRRRYIHKHDQ